jgi:hypothetical protein
VGSVPWGRGGGGGARRGAALGRARATPHLQGWRAFDARGARARAHARRPRPTRAANDARVLSLDAAPASQAARLR